MSKIIKKVTNIESIETFTHSTINDIQHDDEYVLTGWVKGSTINNDPKLTSRIKFLETENKNLKSQISSPNNKILGRFTTTELMSILSSVNLCDKILNIFDDNDLDNVFLSQLQTWDLYNANALDYFYSLFSLLSLGIPNELFDIIIEDEELAIFLECASILVSCDLIEITDDNNLQLTDVAKKFYVQLLSINYTTSINLLTSLIELTDF